MLEFAYTGEVRYEKLCLLTLILFLGGGWLNEQVRTLFLILTVINLQYFLKF